MSTKFPVVSTRRHPLPVSATAALNIIMESGSRTIRRNDLEVRMCQQGFNGRDIIGALAAFERRGWIMVSGGQITVSDKAEHQPAPPRRAKSTRRIPRLFS